VLPLLAILLIAAPAATPPQAPDRPAAPASHIRFVDRSDAAGITMKTVNGDPDRVYIIDTLGSGSAMFDYDLDGDLDIYIANGSLLEPFPPGQDPLAVLYRNDGGLKFTDVTSGSGLELAYWGFGVTAGDFDNDGDPDLYVTAWGPNHLFMNNGDGTFTDIAAAAGVDHDGWGTSTAFFDYDLDGLLDLFVVNYVDFDPAKIPAKNDPDSPCIFRGMNVECGPHGLTPSVDILYHNNGDGTFSDVSRKAGILSDEGYFGLGIVTVDLDGDGLQDALVANDSSPNNFYRNQGDGTFIDEGVMSGFAYSSDGREQAGMGIYSADLDEDGDLDMFVTNFSHDYSTLQINEGGGFLEDASLRLGLVEPTVRSLSWGAMLLDLDNDGDLDIFTANGHVYPEVDAADMGTSYRQRNQIFENLGNLQFREMMPSEDGENPVGLEHADLHRGVAGGDLDEDGDIDLFVTVQNGQPRLLINETTSQGGWLRVRLVGHASNRDAVGARVTVRGGGRSWVAERQGGGSYLSASDPALHFGLGGVKKVDEITIRWPSGTVQSVQPAGINRSILVEEPPAAASGGGERKPLSTMDDPS